MSLLPNMYHPTAIAKKARVKVFSLFASLFLPFFAHAQCTPCTPGSGTICNPIKACTFGDLVEAVAKAITAIGIPLVAIFLVWSGFLFVSARGNEEQLKRAKNTFAWALIGGAVLIGARVLAIAIVNFAKGLG